MVYTSDLTLSELPARCKDNEVRKYIEAMPPLPPGVSVCKFLAFFLDATATAQAFSNDCNRNIKAGEILNTYPSIPTKTETLKDAFGNIVCYVFVYELKVLIGSNKRDVLPVYK